MRIGFNTMDKTDAHLVQNRRVANSRQLIEDEFHGFMATQALWKPTPETLQALTFMEWEPQQMRFVTSYSLQDAWRGRPQIAALAVIPGESNQGVRLIVNETPYTGPAQAGELVAGIENNVAIFAPIIPGPNSFVLADRLAYCRFSYLEPRPEPPFRLWRPDWARPDLIPLAVRIEMAPVENTPGELHVTTVTVPMNVNRSPAIRYSDATQ
jgi:hypothetical protein